VPRGIFVARSAEAIKGDGSRGWTRTNDPLINSQLLYRLSYSGPETEALDGRKGTAAYSTGPLRVLEGLAAALTAEGTIEGMSL
jgi:hypothetical protein